MIWQKKIAKSILKSMKKSIVYKSRGVVFPLSSALLRPHLGYGVQFWVPHLRKDVNNLEKIQRAPDRSRKDDVCRKVGRTGII